MAIIQEIVEGQRQWSGSVRLPAPYDAYSLEANADMDILLNRIGSGKYVRVGSLVHEGRLYRDELWDRCYRIGAFTITEATLVAFVRDLLPESMARPRLPGRLRIAAIGDGLHLEVGLDRATAWVCWSVWNCSVTVAHREDDWRPVDDLEDVIETLFRRRDEKAAEGARQHRRFGEWKRSRRLGESAAIG